MKITAEKGGNKMSKLSQIYDFLTECGVNAEFFDDRIDSYVNIGNKKRKRERIQFWIPDNSSGIDMYVGVDMGLWYTESIKSPYHNSRWRYSEKECQVRFPDMESMKFFVKKVSSL